MRKYLNSTRFRLMMLVLLAVVPALGLTLYTGLEVRQQASEKAQTDAKRLIRISSDSYNDLIASGHQLLTGLALLPQVSQREAESCNRLIASMLSEFPEYINLAAADPQGNIFCSGVKLTSPVNIADRDYFQRVMNTSNFSVSDYIVSRETQKSTIIMAHPSLNASGKVQAVVTASLDLIVLNQTMTIAQLPENSVFFIIDSKGTVLVRSPDPTAWIGKAIPESEIIKDILSTKSEGTVEAAGMDNTSRVYAFMPVQSGSNNIAYMAIGIPSADIFAEANDLLRSNLISLGFVALLALIAAWILGDILIFRQIKPLLHAAERWTAGDLRLRIGKKNGPVEFMQLSSAFDRMAEAITQREEQIRQGEREAVESASHIKIQRTIIDQREKERLIIARDLHDGPIQELTGITFTLYDIQTSSCPPEVAERLDEVRTTLKEQISQLRNYAGELRPPVLANFGLGNAIQSHLETQQNQHPEIRFQFNETPEGEPLPEEKKIALFRIYQEVITNSFKHSQASEIQIQLAYSEDQVILDICDNGVGFTVTTDWLSLAQQGHLGLVGIQERAEAIDGKLQIHSIPGQGTQIHIQVPRKSKQE